jgi:hypothetical protein
MLAADAVKERVKLVVVGWKRAVDRRRPVVVVEGVEANRCLERVVVERVENIFRTGTRGSCFLRWRGQRKSPTIELP